ncbi:hypothetical protein F5144DRAFT_594747 [Chaetomium tenue]|uniref:Uncharacterized protein n=1 Tax=Chaetomium tenue TaxID=1854479 RepID=A0ACB7P4G8_9PEZI|nr:hypothetical protein F5144DRAFT_594747 [Chaetomium globosum]
MTSSLLPHTTVGGKTPVKGVTGKKRRAMMILVDYHGWGGIPRMLHQPHESGVARNSGDSSAVENAKECLFGVVIRSGNAEIAREKEGRATSRSGGVEKKRARCELKAKLSGRVVNKRKQMRLKEAGTGVLSRREQKSWVPVFEPLQFSPNPIAGDDQISQGTSNGRDLVVGADSSASQVDEARSDQREISAGEGEGEEQCEARFNI